jgi:type I restriction enzyme S subunit
MNSIVSWKNYLPKSWEALPLKAVASYAVSSVDKLTKDDEIPVKLCNYLDVYKNDFITEELDFMNASATADEIKKYSIEIGDVLITKDSESWDDIGIPALVTFSGQNVLCGYHLAVIKPASKRVNPEFLFRCIQSKEIRVQLELASTGVTRFGLPKDEIGRLILPIPELNTQQRITIFLNKEIQRIDSLVKAKEILLDRLTEKRQALITRVVTNGLNPKAKMKHSGIEWLGEIPAHWKIPQLKFLSTEPLMYGANEAALEDNPYYPRFVRITDIDEEGNLRPDTFKSLEPELATPYLLKDGDILLARSGATVGKAFMYQDSWGIACFAGYLIRFRCNTKKLLPEYLILITQSQYYWTQVNSGMIQATIQNFSGEKYGSMKILVPELEEQKQIISYLNKELSHIDSIRKLTERTIRLLIERRSSLITAAVTGQISIK